MEIKGSTLLAKNEYEPTETYTYKIQEIAFISRI